MAKLKLSFPVFRQPKAVVYGVGCRKSLAQCRGQATVLFVSGNDHVRSATDSIFAGTDAAPPMIVKPPGEPTLEMVQDGARVLSRSRATRIVGIGGGSVLDWCRLCWAEARGLLTSGGRSTITIDTQVQRDVDLWLVPTTCATGAEASAVAVLADADGNKIPVISEHFVADRVFLDGHFVSTLSARDLSRSLADAISHCIESYLSIIPSPLAKDFAICALRRIFQAHSQIASPCRDQEFMEASFLAGVAASNASVGVIHAFAHSIARNGIGHGHANAMGLAAGIRLNADVPAMTPLLARCGVRDVDELMDRIVSIVRPAFTGADLAFVSRFQAGDARQDLIHRMLSDVCVRTNARRITASDLSVFLDDVVATVSET